MNQQQCRSKIRTYIEYNKFSILKLNVNMSQTERYIIYTKYNNKLIIINLYIEYDIIIIYD